MAKKSSTHSDGLKNFDEFVKQCFCLAIMYHNTIPAGLGVRDGKHVCITSLIICDLETQNLTSNVGKYTC